MPDDGSVPIEVPLVQNRLLCGVPEPALSAIAAMADEVTVAEGTVVFEEGDPADYLYLVLTGSLRVSRGGPGGQQLTLAHLGPGDYIGELAFLDTGVRSARVTAALPARLARLDEASFRAALEMEPAGVWANLTRAFVDHVRLANDRRVQDAARWQRLSALGAMATGIVHDLKSPITTIRLLADAAPGGTAELLHRSVDRMLALVQDLLDYSRGEASVRREPVRMADVLAELEEQALAGAERSGVRVVRRVAFDGVLCADRNALLRALVNLVRNAVEAMPGGGTLTLAVEPREGELVLAVSDTGCGIPDEVLPTVFEPFVTHGKSGGTGIGMATAKAIVEAHGGRIRVRSRPGEGTTFEVALPLPAGAFCQ